MTMNTEKKVNMNKTTEHITEIRLNKCKTTARKKISLSVNKMTTCKYKMTAY